MTSRCTDMALLPTLLLLLAGSCVSTVIAATIQVPSALVFDDHELAVRDQSGETIVDLGVTYPKAESLAAGNCEDANSRGCRRWGNGRRLTVTQDSDNDLCMMVQWTLSESDSVMDCFPLGDANWFGGGEEIPQKWPLEKHADLNHSMVTQETGNRGVQDPFWFNSKGLSIYVLPGVPLFMSINNANTSNALCLEAKIADPYRERPSGFLLKYHLCKYPNPKEAFMRAVDKYLGKPTGYPDERMIRHPLWSTWARYKAKISDVIVREFAKEIKSYGFSNSQLEIDDSWETCYGSKIFDTTRFPNATQLVSDLKAEGFRVTIWTHPFIQSNCSATLNEANGQGFLVKNANGIHTHWWNGDASIIDFTKKGAQDWFIQKHKQVMQDTGLDGFKFDAGETSWLPQLPDFSETIPAAIDEQYPSLSTKMYVETCAKFGGISEVRSAYRSQTLPVFLRMVDKDSRWGDNNGLKSLVTTLLQMNMAGYSMILPDMIGGNQYNEEVASQELFIRWLQANTFMPALQYALVPWDYLEKKDETVRIAKKFNDLHAQYADKIIAAMQRNVADGTPVNPPIWWIDPLDKDALKEDSEYLLGEDILVAPVLEENAVERDIYLPMGTWKDQNYGEIYNGPVLIRKYKAPLEVLPWFIKLQSSSSTDVPPSTGTTAAPSAASCLSLSFFTSLPLFVLISTFINQ